MTDRNQPRLTQSNRHVPPGFAREDERVLKWQPQALRGAKSGPVKSHQMEYEEEEKHPRRHLQQYEDGA